MIQSVTPTSEMRLDGTLSHASTAESLPAVVASNAGIAGKPLETKKPRKQKTNLRLKVLEVRPEADSPVRKMENEFFPSFIPLKKQYY